MGRVLLVVLLMLCAGPVSAQSIDKPTAILETVGNSLGLFEIVFSEACTQQGACTEKNPLMSNSRSAGGTAQRAGVKAAGQAASSWLILKASKDPRLVWPARLTSIGKIVLNGWLTARALDANREK